MALGGPAAGGWESRGGVDQQARWLLAVKIQGSSCSMRAGVEMSKPGGIQGSKVGPFAMWLGASERGRGWSFLCRSGLSSPLCGIE